jgi:small neutral amino acid transporter SnatA (MarC family)
VSDLPPPRQSLRTALSLHALAAAGILLLVALTGGTVAKALGVAAAYFVLAGGWSAVRVWRAERAARASEQAAPGRDA